MSTRVNPQMSEAALEAFFAARVKHLGWYSIKVAPTDAGAPDRMVLLPGGVIRLVELKTCKGQLSLVQQCWHDRAKALGTEVVVLYGPEHVIRWLRLLVDAQSPRPGRPGRPSREVAMARRVEARCVEQAHDDCQCRDIIAAVLSPERRVS